MNRLGGLLKPPSGQTSGRERLLPTLRTRLVRGVIGTFSAVLFIYLLAVWGVILWNIARKAPGLSVREVLSLSLPQLTWTTLLAFVVFLFAALVGRWLIARLTAPLRQLADTAAMMSDGKTDSRAANYDMDELQRIACSLNALADQLQTCQKEFREFVAQASHELRTPLTAVKLHAEALSAGAIQDSGVAQRFLKDIEQEVDRLARMVNDLLDLSRLESGVEVSRRTLLNLGTMVTEVGEDFAVRAERAGIQLHVWVQPNLPSIYADEDQLWRVLMNLLDNALHYTPPGGRVDLRVGNDPHRGVIHFEVQDSGVGIPPEDLPHIFKPFYRTQSTRQRSARSPGSGLGLAICKSIIEHHGGRIGVDSRLGQGSTFWFDLPAVNDPSTPPCASP